MMSDKEFAELELRATICPGQCQWPTPEHIHWQKLHAAANEARERLGRRTQQWTRSISEPISPKKTRTTNGNGSRLRPVQWMVSSGADARDVGGVPLASFTSGVESVLTTAVSRDESAADPRNGLTIL